MELSGQKKNPTSFNTTSRTLRNPGSVSPTLHTAHVGHPKLTRTLDRSVVLPSSFSLSRVPGSTIPAVRVQEAAVQPRKVCPQRENLGSVPSASTTNLEFDQCNGRLSRMSGPPAADWICTGATGLELPLCPGETTTTASVLVLKNHYINDDTDSNPISAGYE